MKRSRQQSGFFDGLVVDLFAGLGGASLGIEAGLVKAGYDRPIDIAINHSQNAIACHQANHPRTHHLHADIFEIDPMKATAGRPVGLLWASPDCTHFSKARGGKPCSKRVRSLATVVVQWARKVRPRLIMLENVEEFVTWGPLDKNDRPCPRRKGMHFKRWVTHLRTLGYVVEWRELRACDYGSPTIRKRLFVIARCDGLPIVWPEPTHGKGLRPYRTAARCIDWALPCPSIFLTKKQAKAIGCKRPLVKATQGRLANGLLRYVINDREPFIVRTGHFSNVTGKGAGFRGQSTRKPLSTVTSVNDYGTVTPLVTPVTHRGKRRSHRPDEPIPTVTGAQRGEHALVSPTIVPIQNYGNDSSGNNASEPLRTITAHPKRGGFAVVSAFLAKHYGGVVGSDARKPIGTVTAVDHHSLAVAHLAHLRGTNRNGHAANRPAPTVTGGGTHLAQVRAFLCAYFGNDKDGQTVRDPMRTVTARERFGPVKAVLSSISLDEIPAGFWRVWAFLKRHLGKDAPPPIVFSKGVIYFIVDIGMRMLTPRELARAQGFPEGYHIDVGPGNRTLTKTEQVKLIGNSVCPQVAQALVEANYVESEIEIAV